jgi:hypothetical protein
VSLIISLQVIIQVTLCEFLNFKCLLGYKDSA